MWSSDSIVFEHFRDASKQHMFASYTELGNRDIGQRNGGAFVANALEYFALTGNRYPDPPLDQTRKFVDRSFGTSYQSTRQVSMGRCYMPLCRSRARRAGKVWCALRFQSPQEWDLADGS